MAKFIFTWENLRYSVDEKRDSIWQLQKKKKVILDGVSGSAFSGALTCIMGVSACGKTTLLTLLSGQRRGRGVLKINGRIITGKMLRSNSAFLQQKDYFMENLTVYEHMAFMAAMSLQKKSTERYLIINKLLKDLSLDNLRYTLVQYLSGGEKRRLSLAANLLLDPYILFCDEPTSGLDSFSAILIVKILESVAASGKIVFLSVNQPSSQLFEFFDNIVLLSNHGKVVFQGSKDNAKSFFKSQNLPCPNSYNPADFFINCITIHSSADELKVSHLIDAFNKEYAVHFNFSDGEYYGLLLKYRENKMGFFFMLGWLTWRLFLTMKRQIKQYLTTFLLIMITAFIIGITYSNTTLDGIGGVQSIQGALLLIVSELIFNQMHQVLNIFPKEIEIFVQEKHLYTPSPYFLSKIILLLPFSLIHSLGFLAVYFLCLSFLGTLELFLQLYIILLLTSISGCSLGLCLLALFPTLESIHLFMVPLEMLALVMSGLWIKIDTLPKIFSNVKYFSPFYFSFESVNIVYWLKVDRIGNCTQVADIPCYSNGTEVLKSYDFVDTYSRVRDNLLFLLLLTAVYCYLGYIGILRKRALYHI